MRITGLRTLHADGGWRTISYVRLEADDGLVGWAEYSEATWSPGLTSVVEALAPHVVGRDPRAFAAVSSDLRALVRMSPGGLASQAVAAIENACIDLAGKAAGVPAHALFGGPVRDRVRAYWSHCGSFRATRGEALGTPPLTDLAGWEALGREVRERGFTAAKTNPVLLGPDGPQLVNPGFAPGLEHARLPGDDVIAATRAQLEALRAGAGPGVDLMLDINFSARGEGIVRFGRALDDLGLAWLEADLHEPQALADARARIATPIASCEALYGVLGYRPYLQARAADVAVVDVPWNGLWESLRIAALADAFEVAVAPHNFYGHLATHMSLHFAAAAPNLRILELEVDDVPWQGDLVTHSPVVRDGFVEIPDGPGWGCDVDEEAVAARPPGAR
jgi:L-alanine-DL-glutamate epimerase-like enolase superfamily enzyme